MTHKKWTVGGPTPSKVPTGGYVEQRTNEDANHRRAAKRRIGSRQFKKMRRAMRLQGAA